MPSFKSIISVVAVGFVTLSTAAPAAPKADYREWAPLDLANSAPEAASKKAVASSDADYREWGFSAGKNAPVAAAEKAVIPPDTDYREWAGIYARQAAAPPVNAAAAAAGITDVDILQFALTLEFLETAFYSQGFAMFSDADFLALGLSAADLANLKSIGQTEQVHVTTLLSAISGAGFAPVAPCTYNFGFKTAAEMVATASVLENVGVSAYLGAAPLVANPAILTVAAEIVTVEARHQTFIRTASKSAAVPSAFDTPLGVRNVFSLAAGFITSCPTGSNLQIKAFPAMTSTTAAADIKADAKLQVSTTATGATFCAFTNGGQPGGTVFSAFTDGGCIVPQNLAGITYVNLASAGPASGVLTDAITVAGPMVVVIS